MRRILRGLLTIWFVLTLVFAGTRVSGDPVRWMLPDDASPGQVDELTSRLGLDRSILVQYVRYLGELSEGDFGQSFLAKRPATTVFVERVPATLLLATVSLLIATAVGVVFGVMAASYRNGPVDRFLMGWAVLGQATPNFVLGIALILAFSFSLRLVPSGGLEGWNSLILPVVTLASASMAGIARMVRAGMLDVLGHEHIQTARSKGLPEFAVVFKHALRNACLPVVGLLGVYSGTMIAGSVVVETVFAWPGVGRLIVTSAAYGDFPVLQLTVIVVAASVVLVNGLVDLLYGLIDPRIRLS